MMSLNPITHPGLAPFRHGFFTREGGVSAGIFAGLNCGPGSSDQREAVATNRRLVCAAMGADEHDLSTVHQVHSADVHVVGDTPTAAPRPKCDAMVSRTKGAVLGILTADCQPVLFADPNAGVIGAAHAGWKGALGGVLEATIEAMIALGAQRESIRAIIGPSISQPAYEVGPEFRAAFLDQAPEHGAFFQKGRDDRYQFDLPGFGLTRLRSAGIAQAHWTGDCTFSDASRFFSYRRTTHNREPDYGRLISVICL
jgi:YfiH family protein